MHYDEAVSAMNTADTEKAYRAVADKFKQLSGYKNAEYLAEDCLVKADEARKEKIYSYARAKIMNGRSSFVEDYEAAIEDYETIIDWKDAREQINICRQKIEKIRGAEERRRQEEEFEAQKVKKREKRNRMILCLVVAGFAVWLIITVLMNSLTKDGKYDNAINLTKNGQYSEAIDVFSKLGDYEDSAEKLELCQSYEAGVLLKEGKEEKA